MTEISPEISYIESSDEPLSADIGIINDNGTIWLYDVGNDERRISELNSAYNVVISHFHKDHAGSIGLIDVTALYGSKETCRHTGFGNIVKDDIYIGNVHIFPIPSSHCKGCLGLETGNYAFIGDAIYGRRKDGKLTYNAQLLKDEIECLKKLNAKYLLISHSDEFVKPKDEIIKNLKAIYATRTQNSPEIFVAEMY